jgi:heat-inducible transcriptional repressor
MLSKENRKKKILGIVVKSYIYNARPVGSSAVSYMLGVSSATVRNVMYQLEEEGFITHPHTSAGRIPTDKGYRCYVDFLMQRHRLTKKTLGRIKAEYGRMKTLEDVTKKSVEILSKITRHASIAFLPAFKEYQYEAIRLFKLSGRRVYAVLVTRPDIVKGLAIETAQDLDSKELEIISNFLNEILAGRELSDAEGIIKNELRAERESFRDILRQGLEIMRQAIQIGYEDRLFSEAPSEIFRNPELRDINTTERLIKIIETKARITRLLSAQGPDEDIYVRIGAENKCKDIRDFTIITSKYKIAGNMSGRVGVIGPTRMEYGYVIPAVKCLAEMAEDFLRTEPE